VFSFVLFIEFRETFVIFHHLLVNVGLQIELTAYRRCEDERLEVELEALCGDFLGGAVIELPEVLLRDGVRVLAAALDDEVNEGVLMGFEAGEGLCELVGVEAELKVLHLVEDVGGEVTDLLVGNSWV
jgi:hypothetical protein